MIVQEVVIDVFMGIGNTTGNMRRIEIHLTEEETEVLDQIARNGSRAGMRVARGGELNMEHFDDWFPKHYRPKPNEK